MRGSSKMSAANKNVVKEKPPPTLIQGQSQPSAYFKSYVIMFGKTKIN